jgi:hypothetical protein
MIGLSGGWEVECGRVCKRLWWVVWSSSGWVIWWSGDREICTVDVNIVYTVFVME